MLATNPAPGGLDYCPCRYGQSRVSFRGPRRQLRGRYVTCLGGTETFGQFVAEPFADLLDAQLGVPCVNFGVPNGGLDVLLNEPEVMYAAASGALTVLALPGAQNVSNRHYKVHPRRNDRFLRPSPELARLYPEIDFTEYHFTRHLLLALQEAGPERFGEVIAELRKAWAARVRQVIAHLRGKVILLWLPRPSGEEDSLTGPDPLFVTRAMVEELRGRVIDVATVRASPHAQARGTKDMVYSEFEEGAARDLPNPTVHVEIARVLQPMVSQALG